MSSKFAKAAYMQSTLYAVARLSVCLSVCSSVCITENMKKCEMQPSTLSIDSQDRSNWRSQCQEAVKQFEDARVAVLQHKRAVRKGEAQPTSNLGAWPCDSCSRICHSRIGLYTHQLQSTQNKPNIVTLSTQTVTDNTKDSKIPSL